MPMRTAARTLFLPVYAASAAGVVAAGAAGQEFVIIGIVAIALLLSFIAERAVPFELSWNEDRGDRWRDVVHALVNEGSIVASMLLLGALADPLSPLR